MQYTLKNKIDFSPIKIVKGEQLYAVSIFIDEMRKLFLWEHPEVDKERLNIFIDGTIYHVSREIDKADSELLNYKAGDAGTPITSITEIFDMQHIEKWCYLKNIFCLYAHFLAMKLYKKLNDGIEQPDTDEIISKLSQAYEIFRDDLNESFADILNRQEQELEKLKD